MFWNRRRNRAQAAQDWAEHLAAGEQDEPTLAIAARLQAIELTEPPISQVYKERLQQQLVELHEEVTADQQPPARGRSRRQMVWFWLVPIIVVVALLYDSGQQYGEQRWLPTFWRNGIDDWQYSVVTWPEMATWFNDWPMDETFLRLVRMSVQSFGWIVALCLLFLLGRRLYNRLRPAHRLSAYWAWVARRGMGLSMAAGVMLVVIGTLLYSQGTQVTFLSFSSTSQMRQGRSVPLSAIEVAPEASVGQPAPVVQALPDAAAAVKPFAFGIEQQPSASTANSSTIIGERRIYNHPYALRITSSADTIGLAVGGAKDINNFRENIAQGYLPLPTDVTVEGLFYDYYFATGQTEPCAALFCPSYAQATSRDPISGAAERFVAVGLNSGITVDDFARKRLNLVIVLDISGSMDELFTRYHYDNPLQPLSPLVVGEEQQISLAARPKIEAATQAIAALFGHLQAGDRLGIVLFNDSAHLAKGMRDVGETDMASIRDHVLALQADGGTNMEAGYRMATDLLNDYAAADPAVYENRIIFLTDAQPNTGATGQSDLLQLTEAAAAQRIFTSFIGVGVDFNTTLIEGISKVPGANYYAVHAPDEFTRRMDEEFDFMVTPLLFDLTLTFDSPDYAIAKVYGSPEADAATGELMRINTLFPSASRGGETKGGLVLLQLAPKKGKPTAGKAHLTVTYTDRTGTHQSNTATVTVPGAATADENGDHYDHKGIRKGILLIRYANLLRNWINDSRAVAAGIDDWAYPNVSPARGIPLPETPPLGQWERQSLPLTVSAAYQETFGTFREYFATEMEQLGDESLAQEMQVLTSLSNK